MATSVDAIFLQAQEKGASDVHLSEGVPILFRIDTDLVPASKGPATAEAVTGIIQGILGPERYAQFEKDREIDVSYAVNKGPRLRVNCHFERGFPSMVARLITEEIPTMEEVGLVGVTDRFLNVRDGLILFTGPTGAGKSTSMAAMIQEIRTQRNVNIITLEDPVEFVYPRTAEYGGIVRQRQKGDDFTDFPEAMKRILRQDPDIVLVGEMRDIETIAAALTLAETGHLVFGTLHTPNTMQTIDRIVDVFSPHQQPQIRSQLSLSLKVIVAQRLLPKTGGGMVALREVLVNTPATANIIRENRTPELVSALQMGGQDGMITMEKAAEQLYTSGAIDDDTYEIAQAIVKADSTNN